MAMSEEIFTPVDSSKIAEALHSTPYSFGYAGRGSGYSVDTGYSVHTTSDSPARVFCYTQHYSGIPNRVEVRWDESRVFLNNTEMLAQDGKITLRGSNRVVVEVTAGGDVLARRQITSEISE